MNLKLYLELMIGKKNTIIIKIGNNNARTANNKIIKLNFKKLIKIINFCIKLTKQWETKVSHMKLIAVDSNEARNRFPYIH